MAVLPESMNRIDPQNTEESLRIIDQYIRYMSERIEFSQSQMTKTVSAAGVSSAEVYILLQALNSQVASLQSTLNQAIGRINSIDGKLVSIESAQSALSERIGSIESSISSIDATLAEHERRIEALESK